MKRCRDLLKRKIKSTVTRLDELSIAFDYEGEVTATDAPGGVLAKDRPAVRAGLGKRPRRRPLRSGRRRRLRLFLLPTCKGRSTASNPTSFSRICCGSSTTSSALSRVRSNCGLPSWKSATSTRDARACPRSGSRIKRNERGNAIGGRRLPVISLAERLPPNKGAERKRASPPGETMQFAICTLPAFFR